MSDSLKIALNEAEYNAVFSVASTLTGTYSKVAASKAMEIIREAVQAGSTDNAPPKKITVDFPKKVLDGFYFGIVEKAKDEKANASDLLQLKAIAGALKMKGRFEKFVDTELSTIESSEEGFDADEIPEPFDGE